MEIIEAGLTCKVAAHDPALLRCIKAAARASGRPVGPLHLQALLQLPRVADAHGFVPIQVADALLAELSQEIPPISDWAVHGPALSPRSLEFQQIDMARAHDVMERFHYLRSPRLDSRAYGLATTAGNLVAVCVSSPLDVRHLSDLLVARGRSSYLARVISRVFAFEGAPKNSISYLLSRAARSERRLGITDFVTYVNPNMGFTGTSYRASGWHVIGDEPGTRYLYLDNRYTTDRKLAAEYGRHDNITYRRLLGHRFTVSNMPLDPLLVFHTHLN